MCLKSLLDSLQCLGPSLHLKKKFGEGYTLRVNFKVEDTEKVVEFISQAVPTANQTQSFPGKQNKNDYLLHI